MAEAEELMIGISEKEAEETTAERVDAARHSLRLAFWRQALDALEKAGVDLYANVSPGRDHWLNAGSGLSGAHYCMIFSKDEARVEFVLSSDRSANKAMFDFLHSRKEAITGRFGSELQWRRMDDRRASMIVHQAPFDGFDRENWPSMTAWLVSSVSQLESTFEPEIAALRQIKVRTSADNAEPG